MDRTPNDDSDTPTPWASYAVPLGSPGSTTSGQFRFWCSAAQAPCKISIGAAVISARDEPARFHARVLIHKEDGPTAPLTFCEYADGDNNTGPGIVEIKRVPTLQDALTEMRDTHLNMGVGNTLDCLRRRSL